MRLSGEDTGATSVKCTNVQKVIFYFTEKLSKSQEKAEKMEMETSKPCYSAGNLLKSDVSCHLRFQLSFHDLWFDLEGGKKINILKNHFVAVIGQFQEGLGKE